MLYDVIIIGAGPAGSAAAYDLAAHGIKTLIIDKTNFPRKKPCAGGLTPKTIRLFRYDISAIIEKRCRAAKISISGMRHAISASNPFSNRYELKNILCYMTQRESLDTFCMEQAIKKGATFRVSKGISSIEEKNNHVIVNTRENTVNARYLIGADGVNSFVRRSIPHFFPITKCFAIEANFFVKNPHQYKMEFRFIPDKQCYYWLFPKNDHVNMGIYTSNKKTGRLFLKKKHLFEWADFKLGSYFSRTVTGYPLGTGGWRYKVKSKRIFLTGDAAGFCENFFGEGIYHAVQSGQFAADSIIRAFETGSDADRNYRKKIRAIQKELLISNAVSQWFYIFPAFNLKIFSIPHIHQYICQMICNNNF